MNLNFSLKPEDLKKLLPVLRRAEPYLFGAALIAVFAYTAWVVNGTLNVKAAETTPATATDPAKAAASKITFDKNTIEVVKNLNVVKGEVPVGELGKDDPFN
jgi:hypothetical protein